MSRAAAYPLRSPWQRLALAVVLLAALPAQAQDETPEARFETLFGADLKRVRATTAVTDDFELAEVMVKVIESTGDEPALRQVIVARATELIKRCGAAAPADRSAALLTDLSKIAADSALRAEALAQIAQIRQRAYSTAPASQRNAAGAALIESLLEHGAALEDAAQAGEALTGYRRAETIAASIRSDDREEIHERIKQATPLVALEKELHSAMAVLAEKPGDPAASLTVGRYWCFHRGEWDKGLTHLADGGDEDLSKLAKRELFPPAQPSLLMESGDGWLAQASKQTDPSIKLRLTARALQGYERALPKADAVTKAKLTAQVESLTKQVAALQEEIESRVTGGVAKGLVLWVEPSRSSSAPMRDMASKSKESGQGVTLAAAGETKVLSFSGTSYLSYEIPKAVASVGPAGGTILVWYNAATANHSPLVNRTDGKLDARAVGDIGLVVRSSHLMLWQTYPPILQPFMQSKTTLTPREWHLIGYAWDGKNGVFYIDGKEDSMREIKPPSVSGSHVLIGVDHPGAVEHYTGFIASVRIYNRPLSAKEIERIHSKEKNALKSPWGTVPAKAKPTPSRPNPSERPDRTNGKG